MPQRMHFTSDSQLSARLISLVAKLSHRDLANITKSFPRVRKRGKSADLNFGLRSVNRRAGKGESTEFKSALYSTPAHSASANGRDGERKKKKKKIEEIRAEAVAGLVPAGSADVDIELFARCRYSVFRGLEWYRRLLVRPCSPAK